MLLYQTLKTGQTQGIHRSRGMYCGPRLPHRAGRQPQIGAKLVQQPLLTVHDELVFDTLLEEEEELCEMVKHTMENVVGLEVPLLVEIGKGKTWIDAH